MGKYSTLVPKTVENEAWDWRFSKLTDDSCYSFYIVRGKRKVFIGIVGKSKTGWSASGARTPSPYGVVSGFKTRVDAAIFLLKVCGYDKS